MMFPKMTYEIELASNGWIVRQVEERPQYKFDNNGGFVSSSVIGTERNVTTTVYDSSRYREMIQYIVDHTFTGNGKTPAVILDDGSSCPVGEKIGTV